MPGYQTVNIYIASQRCVLIGPPVRYMESDTKLSVKQVNECFFSYGRTASLVYNRENGLATFMRTINFVNEQFFYAEVGNMQSIPHYK